MMRVVGKVRDGDFHQKVRVVSNDELGDLGDGMNEMTVGLIERDQIRQSLYLAKEVQQALLPRSAPDINGLDIASASVYCDETGGDYYDFFIPEEAGCRPHQYCRRGCVRPRYFLGPVNDDRPGIFSPAVCFTRQDIRGGFRCKPSADARCGRFGRIHDPVFVEHRSSETAD